MFEWDDPNWLRKFFKIKYKNLKIDFKRGSRERDLQFSLQLTTTLASSSHIATVPGVPCGLAS